MKRVLIAAYQFPPMGGSGVQRTSKFVKYLHVFGWEPVVLTREEKGMPLKDESLLEDIPEGTDIIRTRSYDYTALPGIFGLAGKVFARKILIPDGERLWQLLSQKTAVEAVKEKNISLVYTTSYPYSDHLLGLYLKKRFPHIPWVADFRDEWTNNPYLLDKPHNPIRMSIERNMERSVLQEADYLITNTPVMLNNFITSNSKQKNKELSVIGLKNKFSVIPNGYDKEDFKDLDTVMPHNDKFTISYTGALYGRRRPDLFFKAVSELIEEKHIDGEKICINLIGHYKEDRLNALISQFGLSGVITIHPYMEHRQCLQKLLSSDALLLLEGAGPGSGAFYTGKVFEYMNTNRPIIAAIPENGAAAGLIRETGTGRVSDCGNLGEIKQNILERYNNWLSGSNLFSPDKKAINQYERKELTAKLAGVFEKALILSAKTKNSYK